MILRAISIRFSPARAGNSPDHRGPAGWTPVQPRACGELGLTTRMMRRLVGSAPRVRGTRLGGIEHRWSGRFSPARAGNSPIIPPIGNADSVQPRACGELFHGSVAPHRDSGSAPRVRGTLRDHRPEEAIKRFSPARAGNSRAGIRMRKP